MCPYCYVSSLTEICWWITACADSSSLLSLNKSSEAADCRGSRKSKGLWGLYSTFVCMSTPWSMQVFGREDNYWFHSLLPSARVSAVVFVLCRGRFLSKMIVVALNVSVDFCFRSAKTNVICFYSQTLCAHLTLQKHLLLKSRNLLCLAQTKIYKAAQKPSLCHWNSVLTSFDAICLFIWSTVRRIWEKDTRASSTNCKGLMKLGCFFGL